MTKKAQTLISCTHYKRDTSPAICALVDYAAQNPGLDLRNYGDDRAAYRSEARAIQKDWHRVKLALCDCADLGITDADVIKTAPSAFAGRLEWTTAHGSADASGVVWPRWEYMTGQYWPTEYRKAVATVLETAAKLKRQSREPARRACFTIADVKALNAENGWSFFEPGAMKFFKSKIESEVLIGSLFVTSEQNGSERRKFTVRSFDETGHVKTVGNFQAYGTRGQAVKAAQAFHRSLVEAVKATTAQTI